MTGMKYLTGAVLVLLALLLAGCGGKDEESSDSPASAVDVSHAFSHAAAVPGQTIQVLYRFKLAPDWHLYGPFVNDSGFAPSVDLDLPPGWEAGPLQWPAPERYLMPGQLLDHVYRDQLVLVQDWLVPDTALPGTTVKVPAKLNWLVCKDMCVPGSAEIHLALAVAETSNPSPDRAEIQQALAALPVPSPPRALEVAKNGSTIILKVTDARVLEFYPHENSAPLLDLIADGRAEGTDLPLRLKSGAADQPRLRGILHQQLADGATRNWIIDIQPGG
jgi:DsbC/DsbD-like thiol-disulfide interchange protein